jgi:hypothetical protein
MIQKGKKQGKMTQIIKKQHERFYSVDDSEVREKLPRFVR